MTDTNQAGQPAARDCRCPPGICYGDAPVQACWMDWHHRAPSAFSLPAAIAAADKAATERACAAVCWMCKDEGNWHPAEQTPAEFMDEGPPIWGHRPRHHYEAKTEWAFKACDAEKIRAATQPPVPGGE